MSEKTIFELTGDAREGPCVLCSDVKLPVRWRNLDGADEEDGKVSSVYLTFSPDPQHPWQKLILSVCVLNVKMT